MMSSLREDDLSVTNNLSYTREVYILHVGTAVTITFNPEGGGGLQYERDGDARRKFEFNP